jgi:hypothetical protein
MMMFHHAQSALRVLQLHPDLRHRVAWRSLITGSRGHSRDWTPATSENVHEALVNAQEQNQMVPGIYHWVDFAVPSQDALAITPPPAASPGDDGGLQRLEALPDSELSRRVAQALALPLLRYATVWGDAHEMEESLPEAKRGEYAAQLGHVVKTKTAAAACEWLLLRATPRQRCIAALLAMGEG